MQATVKIILRDYDLPIERTSSQLILSLGQRCDAKREEYLDLKNG